MKIEIGISDERLVDIISRANIGYWGQSDANTDTKMVQDMVADKQFATQRCINSPTETATVTIIETPDRPGRNGKKYELTRKKIMRGIEMMAVKYPHKFRELLDESQDDMYTGDFLIQLALFGEEKYA